ncbi:MAG: efflux RND transporter periplasmic adaptor subunit [Clostridia bacterium]|nr:efflux RND transporter periplasmic adaptor subunit [Clostridia bacterium]
MTFNLKKITSSMSKRKKIVLISAVVLLILAVFFMIKGCATKPAVNMVSTVAKVTKGDVEVTLSGSGTVEANEQYNITSLVKGDVVEDYFEEGDVVNEGDPLYKIDSSDMENSIKRGQDSLSKAQRDYSKSLNDQSKLNITAPISGVVTNCYIEKNDTVNKNANVVEITDSENMLLTIDFNASDKDALYVGAPATVYVDSSSTILDGNLTRISTGSVVNSKGASVIKVDILVKNPGTLTPSDTATAITCGKACNSSGTFNYNEKKIIKAEIEGDVTDLYVKTGDKVSKGQTIAKLSSTSLDDSLFNTSMSLSDARLNLDNLYDTLEDYTITSPINGTVIYKETKAGDKLDNSNSSTVMAIVADMSVIKFDIAVDELDISKIEVGQEVSVTADALDGKVFDAYIDYISVVGTTQNGVTTYPVTVIINNPEGLIPGMNVEAKIVVESSKNTLMIPATALNRGNTVWVSEKSPSAKNGKKSENSDLHKGYVEVPVKVGISNDSFVEILSGLSEGDEIEITTVVSNIFTDMMQGHMQGGMGSGMPPSGMRSGGMPSGGGMR